MKFLMHDGQHSPNPSRITAMTITGAGNVGIGTTSPGKKIDVVGGDIRTNGTVIGASSSFGSDDRLKHNEEDISDSLTVIRKLKPQKYQKTKEMKAADFNGTLEEDTYTTEAGFIAQDIKNDIPELAYCVTTSDNSSEPYHLNYNNIFTHNVAATQELDTIVTNLLAEIASLKERTSVLENKL